MGAAVYVECDANVQEDEEQIRVHGYCRNVHNICSCFKLYLSLFVIVVNCVTYTGNI